MKKIIFAVLCLTAVFALCSCADGGGEKSDFAYYFALDKGDAQGVLLYAVIKDGEKTEEKNQDSVFVDEFEGNDVNEAFTQFFDKFKDVYTGTVKEYAVAEALGDEGMTEFKTYLTNSPKLPAKRKTVSIKNAKEYAHEKMAEEKEKSGGKNDKD